MNNKYLVIIVLIIGTIFLFKMVKPNQKAETVSNLSGTIEIDGSSTVFPISEAMAEEFQKKHGKVHVNVGVSGTGGGFKRFTLGETDISNASRPIKESEAEIAKKNGIEYTEFTIALDGIAVVTNKNNDFVSCLTVDELHKIWQRENAAKKWSEINLAWPNELIKLYGPGTDSGTFDYFTQAINGQEDVSRSDYTASEDDNVLVTGVAGDKYSLGYFGFAYFEENKDKLKVLGVDGGKGCVSPAENSIRDASYSPLSRPIFIYVNNEKLSRPEVKEFVSYHLKEGRKLISEVGYIQLTEEEYAKEIEKLEQ